MISCIFQIVLFVNKLENSSVFYQIISKQLANMLRVQIFFYPNIFWRNLCIEVCGSEWAAVGARAGVSSDTRVSVRLRYCDW